jgi:hypothetical protein
MLAGWLAVPLDCTTWHGHRLERSDPVALRSRRATTKEQRRRKREAEEQRSADRALKERLSRLEKTARRRRQPATAGATAQQAAEATAAAAADGAEVAVGVEGAPEGMQRAASAALGGRSRHSLSSETARSQAPLRGHTSSSSRRGRRRRRINTATEGQQLTAVEAAAAAPRPHRRQVRRSGPKVTRAAAAGGRAAPHSVGDDAGRRHRRRRGGKPAGSARPPEPTTPRGQKTQVTTQQQQPPPQQQQQPRDGAPLEGGRRRQRRAGAAPAVADAVAVGVDWDGLMASPPSYARKFSSVSNDHRDDAVILAEGLSLFGLELPEEEEEEEEEQQQGGHSTDDSAVNLDLTWQTEPMLPTTSSSYTHLESTDADHRRHSMGDAPAFADINMVELAAARQGMLARLMQLEEVRAETEATFLRAREAAALDRAHAEAGWIAFRRVTTAGSAPAAENIDVGQRYDEHQECVRRNLEAERAEIRKIEEYRQMETERHRMLLATCQYRIDKLTEEAEIFRKGKFCCSH